MVLQKVNVIRMLVNKKIGIKNIMSIFLIFMFLFY